LAILNLEHLFEQADRLAKPPPAGRPRQADLRRAISTAYYGVFHAALTAAADQFVGAAKRSTSQYGLVYRTVDHKRLRELCEDIGKSTLPRKLASHAPAGGFGNNIRAFAAAVLELQAKRHTADYDPTILFKTSDAAYAIRIARTAVRRFEKARADRREAFLALLLFQPR
jgi:hypothetical protein